MSRHTLIRPAIPADHPRLEALLARASLATGEHVQDLLANPDALAIPPENLAHTLVIERDGGIAGFCTLMPVTDERYEVDALFVDPCFWRQGLGARLLREAERRVGEAGARTLGVVSGRYAEPFYRAFGFEPDGEEMTRFGPATRLTKSVRSASADDPDA